jgi:hypothetical protein
VSALVVATRVDAGLFEAARGRAGLSGDARPSQIARYGLALAAGLAPDVARAVAYGVYPRVMAELLAAADCHVTPPVTAHVAVAGRST